MSSGEPVLEMPRCPICGGEDHSILARHPKLVRGRCAGGGGLFVAPPAFALLRALAQGIADTLDLREEFRVVALRDRVRRCIVECSAAQHACIARYTVEIRWPLLPAQE